MSELDYRAGYAQAIQDAVERVRILEAEALAATQRDPFEPIARLASLRGQLGWLLRRAREKRA